MINCASPGARAEHRQWYHTVGKPRLHAGLHNSCPNTPFAQDGPRLGIGDNPGEFGGAVHRIDRHRDCADPPGGDQRDDKVGHVLRDYHHPVARADTPFTQPRGEGRALLCQHTIACGLLEIAQRRMITAVGDDLVEAVKRVGQHVLGRASTEQHAEHGMRNRYTQFCHGRSCARITPCHREWRMQYGSAFC